MLLWLKVKICTALIKLVMWIDPHFMPALAKQILLDARASVLERNIGSL